MESTGRVRVGLCQTETVEWDVTGNFSRVLADIRAAAGNGAEVIITPECVLNGYAGPGQDNWKDRFPATTTSCDGPYLSQVRALAASLRVEVVFGFAESAGANVFHNTAAHIGREGEIVYAYRKTHCRPFESADHDGLFTPGSAFFASERTFEAGRFGIGAMICFDREIAESVRCLRALGADLIACPLATNTYPLLGRPDPAAGERADNELVTRARAAENEVCIAVVNHAGRFNGGSYVVGPFGEPLVQLGAGPEVRVVEVPLGRTEEIRRDPWGWMGWGYRRPELYDRYLGARTPRGSGE